MARDRSPFIHSSSAPNIAAMRLSPGLPNTENSGLIELSESTKNLRFLYIVPFHMLFTYYLASSVNEMDISDSIT